MQLTMGIALVLIPILFNWAFAALAKQFEYPDILRQPTLIVLAKFRAGGARLVTTWWLFMLSAVLFAPIAYLVPEVLPNTPAWLAQLVSLFGLLAALVQFLGLARWPFMVPHFAREAVDAEPSKVAAIDVVFQSMNRYLGVAVGEHLGYLFTGLWSASVGLALLPLGPIGLTLGSIGIAIGALLVLCSMEFVGVNEVQGWKFAGAITPFVYIIWSLWLVALGSAVIFQAL
jgi:hypothetical protein